MQGRRRRPQRHLLIPLGLFRSSFALSFVLFGRDMTADVPTGLSIFGVFGVGEIEKAEVNRIGARECLAA